MAHKPHVPVTVREATPEPADIARGFAAILPNAGKNPSLQQKRSL